MYVVFVYGIRFDTREKNQPRIGANPPFGREKSDLLILTLARRVPRKSKICSAEVVRFQRPTRYQHDGSSLHRDRSGKSCRRPGGSHY